MRRNPSKLGDSPFPDTIDHLQKVKYDRFEIKSEYIQMRDGIELAATYCIPKGYKQDNKFSTILFFTRYWRTHNLRFPLNKMFNEVFGLRPIPDVFTARGYVIMFIDCRGSGASYGVRPHPFFDDEILDGDDIIDWVIKQPWSDGKVGSFGISYVGTMGELIARNRHPALKAIAPTHCYYDTYVENVRPGGIYDHGFTYNWEFLCKGLDRNDNSVFKKLNLLTWLLVKGVKTVSTDTKQEKVREAIKEHMDNVYAHYLTSDKPYRNDTMPGGLTYDTISIFTHQNEIEKSDVVYYNLCSWFDSGYGDAVIKRFMNLKNSGIFVIGDWNHGFRSTANPYIPKKSIIPAKNAKEASSKFIHHLVDFFDLGLKEGSIKDKVLYYYTIGEEKWKKTKSWPPTGQSFEKWYLRENNSLSQFPPEEEMGEDTYEVNFKATTGNRNRWWTLLSFPIDYSKRTEQDSLCLTYTSEPIEEDLEITGHAIITLYLTSTHEDGALFVYLEDVDAEENVVYLTEGQIRLIHRKISSENPPFSINVPYHSYKKEDAGPITPSEITEIKFGLLPISALIKTGHKIRISISGHDKDTFRRYPFQGEPVIKIMRNSINTSFIDLPVIKRDS